MPKPSTHCAKSPTCTMIDKCPSFQSPECCGKSKPYLLGGGPRWGASHSPTIPRKMGCAQNPAQSVQIACSRVFCDVPMLLNGKASQGQKTALRFQQQHVKATKSCMSFGLLRATVTNACTTEPRIDARGAPGGEESAKLLLRRS